MTDLIQKAIAHREAKKDYSTAFREYFANQVAELPEDRFWELQAVFQRDVCTFRFGYKRTNGVDQAHCHRSHSRRKSNCHAIGWLAIDDLGQRH